MCPRSAPDETGYSLYELLVTLSIASLILVFAIPDLGALIARQRLRVEINALHHAIHLARKESIVRRQVVSLCPSADGQQCRPGRDWSIGWIMFNNIDRDEPPMVDPGESVLQAHTVNDQVELTANRRGFTLRATVKRATNGTFVACDPAARTEPRALVVSYTGRPRSTLRTTRGDPYRCAH